MGKVPLYIKLMHLTQDHPTCGVGPDLRVTCVSLCLRENSAIFKKDGGGRLYWCRDGSFGVKAMGSNSMIVRTRRVWRCG